MMKLKRYRRLLVVAVLLIVLLVAAISMNDLTTSKSEDRKQVSLIVYGDDPERWENLRQGAGLVCEQKKAGLSLLTMFSENDVGEQEEIIDREIASGADALIIAACNSVEIRDYINAKDPDIPVVFVEDVESFYEKKSLCITPDDYQMGYDLGEELVKNESDIVTVAVVSESVQRDSIALREKGLLDAIEGKVGKVIMWSRDENSSRINKRQFIQKALVSEATDVIVTFDSFTTDALIDALANLNTKSKVYAISTSDKALYNLYSKEIIALGFPDEYAMGYLAAMNALDRPYAKKKYSSKRAEYKIVRKENMYDEENQTLLFPFVN